MTHADVESGRTELRLEVSPGVKLHFVIWPGEGPVILLESGGGEDLTQWGDIPRDVVSRTGATVVTYSRAGFGESDLPDTPYDMKEEVDWLLAGLRQIHLDRDLVLVGHSYGGWLIRLIAHEAPDRVIGMVFVDPFSHELVARVGAEAMDQMSNAESIEAIPESERTKAQRADVRMMKGGIAPKAELMEQTVFPQDLPYRVITCGQTDWLGPAGEMWRSVHEELAAKTGHGKLLIAEGARHMIPADAPQTIVAAVEAVVGEAQRV